jgi:ABC-type lipoprotein release transport system permease subunit
MIQAHAVYLKLLVYARRMTETVWLGLVLILASVAGAVPAMRASRLVVREALAYD